MRKYFIFAGALLMALVVAMRRPAINPAASTADTQTHDTSSQSAASSAFFERSTVHRTAAEGDTGCVAILTELERENDPGRRSDIIEHAMETVTLAGISAMLDSTVHDASPAALELGRALVQRWAESDPAAAAAWTAQLPESPFQRALLEQAAIAWADSDVHAAANWVRALPPGDGQQAAALDIAYEAARTDPLAALELGSGLPSSRERDDLLVHAVSQWAATDGPAAVAWASSGSDVALRQRLLAAAVVAWSRQDAPDAATLAVSALPAGVEQDRAVVSIVQRWAQASPGAAAAWVAQFPDGPLRTAATRNLLALGLTP